MRGNIPQRKLLGFLLLVVLSCAWLPILDEEQNSVFNPSIVRASPDQESLRPDADGHTVQFSISDTTHYGATSDNNEATYVWTDVAGEYEYLDVDATSGTGDINWVQVTYRCYASGSKGGEKFDFYIYSDTTETMTDANVVITRDSWNNYTGSQQTTNPATASAWQWSEVDAMEAGLYADSVDSGTEELRCSEIWVVVDYTAGDVDPPTFVYDYPGTATENYTQVPCFTAILTNWSITDASADTYEIYCNETGSNQTVASGAYVSGEYYSYTIDNDNVSNAGNWIYAQIWANDTGGYTNASIVYFNISTLFSLTIIETTFNWTSPNVVKGSGEWVYIDQPAKQYLNMSIKGTSAWELRGYINDTSAELHVKGFVTDSTGGTQPEPETWWDSGGTEFTGSEQVIAGADNQPAGDYSASGDNYIVWLVVQVDQGGASYYGILLTIVIYSE